MNKTGGVFTKEIPYTPRIPIVSSFLKTAKTQNETIINGVELSSRALERFSKDMYFNTLIELAKKEPVADIFHITRQRQLLGKNQPVDCQKR